MSDITPYAPGGGLSRDARRAGRAITRGRARTQVRVSETDDVTDVAITKVENLTMATGSAMTSVVRIAKAQQELEVLSPQASARLNFLADSHMLGCSELLDDLRRDMRRIR